MNGAAAPEPVASDADRVRAHTSDATKRELDVELERRVRACAEQGEAAIDARLRELDREWDIERWLELNASALAFAGVAGALRGDRKLLALPAVVLPFLFQHAVQGWCPPLPVFRRLGVRTSREIDAERYALKALRGDFADVDDPADALRAVAA